MCGQERETGDEHANDMENTRRCGRSGVHPAGYGLLFRLSVCWPARLEVVSALSGIIHRSVYKFAAVPVSYGDYHHLLWSLSFSSSPLTSPENTKFSHPSLCSHAIMMIRHWVQNTASTLSTEDRLSPGSTQVLISHLSLDLACSLLYTFPRLQGNQWLESQLRLHLPIDCIQINHLRINCL